jgi:Cu/Ag efflux pump CusA
MTSSPTVRPIRRPIILLDIWSDRRSARRLQPAVERPARMRHAARAADHPQRAVEASIQFPPGTYVVWSASMSLERAKAWLQIVVPATLLIIFLLLYLNCRSITETMIVMLSLPFALVGGLWLSGGSATIFISTALGIRTSCLATTLCAR